MASKKTSKTSKKTAARSKRPPRQLFVAFYRNTMTPTGDISSARGPLADLDDRNDVVVHGPFVLAERVGNR